MEGPASRSELCFKIIKHYFWVCTTPRKTISKKKEKFINSCAIHEQKRIGPPKVRPKLMSRERAVTSKKKEKKVYYQIYLNCELITKIIRYVILLKKKNSECNLSPIPFIHLIITRLRCTCSNSDTFTFSKHVTTFTEP